MIRFFLVFATIVITSFSHRQNDPIEYDLIIQNAKLFDGETIYDCATIFVKGGLIKKIITDSETSYKAKNVIEGRGYTIVPGLLNAHVHARKKEHTHEAVNAGVLTLLDLFNCEINTIDSLKILGNSSKAYAYYFSAGNTVTVPEGHCTQYGPVPTISKADDVPEFIADRIAEGSDYIKLVIDRGAARNPRPTLDDEMLDIAIQTTRNHGLVSVVHISSRQDAIKASKFGVNVIAHIWRKETTEIANNELDVLLTNKVFIIPTLVVRNIASKKNEDINMDLIMKDVLTIHEAGVPLLAGTDSPGYKLNYGTSLFDELELLTQAGLTELEALKSATSNTSKAFNLGERGYIRQGYSADFILIQGDPTQDISDIRNISKVWKKGQLLTTMNSLL
jgi:imidazolonepropionase-like amidohydrolase